AVHASVPADADRQRLLARRQLAAARRDGRILCRAEHGRAAAPDTGQQQAPAGAHVDPAGRLPPGAAWPVDRNAAQPADADESGVRGARRAGARGRPGIAPAVWAGAPARATRGGRARRVKTPWTAATAPCAAAA